MLKYLMLPKPIFRLSIALKITQSTNQSHWQDTIFLKLEHSLVNNNWLTKLNQLYLNYFVYIHRAFFQFIEIGDKNKSLIQIQNMIFFKKCIIQYSFVCVLSFFSFSLALYSFIYMYIYTHSHIFVNVSIYVCVYMYIDMYICIRLQIYTQRDLL